MTHILITGMSGTGKTSVLEELTRRGYRTVETDVGGWSVWHDAESGWLWDEARMAALLAGESDVPLFVSGCVANQGRFYDRFDAVVLLSAPLDVVLKRVQERTNNPYGKTAEQQAEIAANLREVEPLLRHGATLELDSSRLSVADIADALEQLLHSKTA